MSEQKLRPPKKRGWQMGGGVPSIFGGRSSAMPLRNPGLRLFWHQCGFGLALHFAAMMNVRAGAGAGDLVVHFLRVGIRGTDEEAARERNGIETFAGARP